MTSKQKLFEIQAVVDSINGCWKTASMPVWTC